MKVYFFESSPLIKTAWQSTVSDLDTVWVEGMLTLASVGNHTDAEIICTDMSILDATCLSAFKRLKLIAVRATGVDNVDLEYCHEKGITVCNVPAYARTAVAEHVFALLLALGRHVVEASRRTRRLDFSWTDIQGFELFAKTLAVVGAGAIGRRVAEIAKGFGMVVVAVDSFPDEPWATANKVSYLPLDDALRRADVVSLHVPGIPETRHLISAERFELMKKGVVIINTSRGDVLDAQALLGALTSGKVAGAGLDVLPEENDLMAEYTRLEFLNRSRADCATQLTNHLLLQHPRVLVTPHCAFFTKEAAARLMQITVDNITAFIKGDDLINVVQKELPE